jgi:hypothetical protein
VPKSDSPQRNDDGATKKKDEKKDTGRDKRDGR